MVDGQGLHKGHIAKAMACEIPKRHDWHGDTDGGGGQVLSKITHILCQPNFHL